LIFLRDLGGGFHQIAPFGDFLARGGSLFLG